MRRWVEAHWHEHVTGIRPWPGTFALGGVAKGVLETDFAIYQRLSFTWSQWAAHRGLDLTWETRRVHGTIQRLPTHLAVPDLNTAATVIGDRWEPFLARSRHYLALLQARFPAVDAWAPLLRTVAHYSPIDFELLCTTAAWFQTHTAAGLTPRQVPVPGLHAKWLNTHHGPLLTLTGLDTLDLLPGHPQRIHFTYLDPAHRARKLRAHDSATVGDTMTPAYAPETVVISENKDTALHFLPMEGAIAVEGAGYAGAPGIAALHWIAHAPRLIYWGDIDAAGFEIVHRYRDAGLPVRTVLTDLPTYDAYECFGTTTDARGKPLKASPGKNLPLLTTEEKALYERLTDPGWNRVRRIEQERIPLPTALDAVRRLTDPPAPSR
jgi:hypothetical protein